MRPRIASHLDKWILVFFFTCTAFGKFQPALAFPQQGGGEASSDSNSLTVAGEAKEPDASVEIKKNAEQIPNLTGVYNLKYEIEVGGVKLYSANSMALLISFENTTMDEAMMMRGSISSNIAEAVGIPVAVGDEVPATSYPVGMGGMSGGLSPRFAVIAFPSSILKESKNLEAISSKSLESIAEGSVKHIVSLQYVSTPSVFAWHWDSQSERKNYPVDYTLYRGNDPPKKNYGDIAFMKFVIVHSPFRELPRFDFLESDQNDADETSTAAGFQLYRTTRELGLAKVADFPSIESAATAAGGMFRAGSALFSGKRLVGLQSENSPKLELITIPQVLQAYLAVLSKKELVQAVNHPQPISALAPGLLSEGFGSAPALGASTIPGMRPAGTLSGTESPRTETEREILDALVQWEQSSTPEDKGDKRDRIAKILAAQFDAQRRTRRVEIGELQERLRALEQAENEKMSAREATLQSRLKQLLGED